MGIRKKEFMMEMAAPEFELIDHQDGDNDHWCIKIKDGEYKGLVYQYQTVSITEEQDENGAVLKFKTAVVENQNNINLTNEKDRSIMGAILVNILDEQLENVKGTDENGTSNTEESNNG
jgi:hypothetical protein